MKKILLAVLLIAQATAFATTVSYTIIVGTAVADFGGNMLTTGTITFTPGDNFGNPMAAAGAFSRAVTCNVSAGVIGSQLNGGTCKVVDALASNPNVCYKVTLRDTVLKTTIPTPGQICAQPTGAIWSYDTYPGNQSAVTLIQTGPPGAAATVAVGSTTTVPAGTSAAVTNSGSSTAAVLNFTIPQGPAATVTVGTTTTSGPGTSASVTNAGTSSLAVLNFTIPSSGGYTGVTSDGVNGLKADGQVQAANVIGPMQPQSNYALRSTLTKIAEMQCNAVGYSICTNHAQLRMRTDGDSTTDMHNLAMVCELTRRFGSAGYIGGANLGPSAFGTCLGSPNAITITGTVVQNNGSTVPYDYTLSDTGIYYTLSPGACEAWTGAAGGYLTANHVGIEYYTVPGGGNLTIYSRLSGGSWVQQGSAIATDGAVAGAVADYTVAEGLYQVEACADTAPVKVHAGALYDTAVNGVILEHNGRAGLKVSDYSSTLTAVTSVFDAYENPDVVFFKHDTNGSTGPPDCLYTNDAGTVSQPFSHWWPLISARWIGSAPLRDVVIDGSYATDDPCIVTQNTVQQKWAVANQKRYFDGYNISGSLANEIALGWLSSGDHAHQTVLGQVAQAEVEMNDLGLNSFFSGAVSNDVINTNTATTNLSAANGNFKVVPNSIDATLTLNRALNINNAAGTQVARISTGADAGNNFAIWARVGSATSPGPGVDSAGALCAGTSANCQTASPFYANNFYEHYYTASANGNYAVDISANGGFQQITANGNLTFAGPSNPPQYGATLHLRICQGGTAYNITFMGQWYGALAPKVANTCTQQTFISYNSALLAVSPTFPAPTGQLMFGVPGLYVNTAGSNAGAGTVTLSAGTATVTNTLVLATSNIILSGQNCTACGYVYATVSAGSFTITSTSGTDASKVYWEIR